MKPAVATGALVAAVLGLSTLARRPPPVPHLPSPAKSAGTPRTSLCPAGTLPDRGVCIPVPRPDRRSSAETLISKRPERPADYRAYRLPVAASGSPAVLTRDVSSTPDAGASATAIVISATPGTPVSALALEGQDGPAEAVFVGKLVGDSVISHHRVHAGDRDKDYVMLLGNLDAVPELAQRTPLDAGTPLGKVGSVPVRLEVRLVRPGVDPFSVPAERLLDDSQTVPVDPRNLLPTK